jgi:hypothetical protein
MASKRLGNAPAVEVRRFKITELAESSYNARTISRDASRALSNSLKSFGLLAHPVISIRDGVPLIVGGHQRIRAMTDMGETEVDCLVVELTAEEEKAANFTLNNPAIQGRFIPEMTADLMDRIRELDQENYQDWSGNLRFDALVKTLPSDVSVPKGSGDIVTAGRMADDEVPHLNQTKAVSQSGSVYCLGDHRIYCGRFNTAHDLSRFDADEASMALSWLSHDKPLAPEFLDVALSHLLQNTVGAIYLPTSFDNLTTVMGHFSSLGGNLDSVIVAYSPTDSGRSDVAYRESGLPILYGNEGSSPRPFHGDPSDTNLWTLHTTPPPKDLPVEVAVRAMLNSSNPGEIVLDIRAFKGASVIAAEKSDRRLYGYAATTRECDRIRARWTQFVHGEDVDWRVLTAETTPNR